VFQLPYLSNFDYLGRLEGTTLIRKITIENRKYTPKKIEIKYEKKG